MQSSRFISGNYVIILFRNAKKQSNPQVLQKAVTDKAFLASEDGKRLGKEFTDNANFEVFLIGQLLSARFFVLLG